MKFKVELYVLNGNSFEDDLILGREFLSRDKLILVYRPSIAEYLSLRS